jgi:hypothetical protein
MVKSAYFIDSANPVKMPRLAERCAHLRGISMRLIWIFALIASLAGVASAQDEIKPDELKKLYNDTLVQLKAAQDRKAELATRVEQQEKQLQSADAQIADLQRQLADSADRTYFLRIYYNAWTQFIAAEPAIGKEWEVYLSTALPAPTPQSPFYDPDWPLSAQK